MRDMKMIAPNDVGVSDLYMPEFGLYGKIDPLCDLKEEWAKNVSEKERYKREMLFDANFLAKEFEDLKNENKILKERLEKIEEELSKTHIIGVHNLMFSRNVIDEIWDEEDDTL
jgi:hypothetical protein